MKVAASAEIQFREARGEQLLTHIKSGDHSGGVPRHQPQIGARLPVEELVLGHEPTTCASTFPGRNTTVSSGTNRQGATGTQKSSDASRALQNKNTCVARRRDPGAKRTGVVVEAELEEVPVVHHVAQLGCTTSSSQAAKQPPRELLLRSAAPSPQGYN
jgi:hypothetical protein